MHSKDKQGIFQYRRFGWLLPPRSCPLLLILDCLFYVTANLPPCFIAFSWNFDWVRGFFFRWACDFMKEANCRRQAMCYQENSHSDNANWIVSGINYLSVSVIPWLIFCFCLCNEKICDKFSPMHLHNHLHNLHHQQHSSSSSWISHLRLDFILFLHSID